MAARSEHGIAECRQIQDGLRAGGYDGALGMLTAGEARALEPVLDESVTGGLYAEDDWYVAPESLCAGLVNRLCARGVRLMPRASLRELVPDGEAWVAQVEGGPPIYADQVVVAAGAWSKALLHQAGTVILLEPAKGYSVTGRGVNPPRHAVYMIETKVGCTPFDHVTRLAGTLELGGLDEAIRKRRLNGVMRSARLYLKEWDLKKASAWAGLRPATPDGLPYIGAVPEMKGLFIATGHNMLGVTLGPATGVAIAAAMSGQPPTTLEAFRPDRAMS
jgi:D-amino-acid dehydrogenase